MTNAPFLSETSSDSFTRPKLVAETDASGDVTHVWLSMPDWRIARPLGTRRVADSVTRAMLSQAEVHGASHGAVSAWLRQKGHIST